MSRIKTYFRRLFIALDQLFNTFWDGYPDETFSARCYRKREQKFWGFMAWLVDRLFFFQPGHCQESYASEQARKHSPFEWRPA